MNMIMRKKIVASEDNINHKYLLNSLPAFYPDYFMHIQISNSKVLKYSFIMHDLRKIRDKLNLNKKVKCILNQRTKMHRNSLKDTRKEIYLKVASH